MRPLSTALLVLVTLTGACSDGLPSASPSDLRLHLLFLNQLQGFAEGVPCNEAEGSPLVRAAQLRDRLRSEGDFAWLACVGDTVIPIGHATHRPAIRRSSMARGQAIIEAMGAAGVDLYVPGLQDLKAVALHAVTAASEAGVPVVLTNGTLREGSSLESYVLLEAEGLTLACLGAIPYATPVGSPGEPSQQTKKVQISGLRLEQPVPAIARVSQELLESGAADLVAVFSNLPSTANTELLGLPSVDFVFGSSDGNAKVVPIMFRGGGAYLLSERQGVEVGHTTVRVLNGDMALRDMSPRHTLGDKIAGGQAWLEPLIAQYGTRDLDELASKIDPVSGAEIQRHIERQFADIEYLELLNHYEGSFLDHRRAQLPPLDSNSPALAALSRQGEAIEEGFQRWKVQPLQPFNRAGQWAHVPKIEACRACHPAQTRFWEGTRHAHARETLAAAGRLKDVACLRCHTAGFQIEGGYWDPRHEGPLGGVTCHSCHWVTSTHSNNPLLVMYPLYVTELADVMDCQPCHDERQSPGFDRDAMLSRVSCPPMRPDELALTEARRRVVDLVAQHREQGTNVPTHDFLEARALIGLGQQEGYTKLREYARLDEDDGRLAISIAWTLDGVRRSADAIGVLRDFLNRQHGDPEVNEEYVRLLLEARDPSARDPAMALRHISLVLPETMDPGKMQIGMRVLHVDALFTVGTPETVRKGLEVLGTLMQLAGSDARVIERVQRYAQ